MHTGFGNVRYLDFGVFAPFPLDDLHPKMVVEGLGQGNGWKVISIVLIPTG
jgi:hypothetical protein